MKQGIYYTGERIKVYFPGMVIRGEVIGVQDVSVEDAAGKYFQASRAYLVMLDVHVEEEKSYIVTAPFMAHDNNSTANEH